MLSTGFSTGLAVFLGSVVLFCCLLVWWTYRLAAYCRAAVEFVQLQNKRSVSLRRMAEVESTLTELSDSYDALLESHRKLRSRIGMRNIREKRKNAVDSDTVPASDADRAAYKAQLREDAKSRGLLR